MKSYNTILSLESIPKPTIYSKYGESLDKLFKSRSLKNLISELKNPKKYIPKEMISPEENSIKKSLGSKENEEELKDIFSLLDQNDDKKDNKENNKKFEPPKFKPRGYIKNTQFIDPFKYNPNYNSISKNIPSVHMILTEKEEKKLKMMREREKSPKNRKKLKIEKPKKIIPKIKTQIEESFITSLKNKKMARNNSSKKREQILPPIYQVMPNKKDRALTIENDRSLKNNHALRFSKYLSRKYDFNNNEQMDKISYLEPYNYLNNKNKNIIDFKKMSFRKEKDFINYSSLGVPSIYDYNPKYNLVEKKPAQVVFTPHNNIKNTKQYLLRKLWGSYDVTSDYKLINREKI